MARKTSKKQRVNPHIEDAIRYAEEAISGEIVVCEMTRLACERFISDLQRQGDKDFPFHLDS